MTKVDDIQERLIQFTNKIVSLCDTLPPTTTAERIGTELLRSTLTSALKLLEARLAETPAECTNNLRIAVLALTVSDLWLCSIIAGDILPPDTLTPLITDCQQLQRLLTTAIKYTARLLDYQTTRLPNQKLPNYQPT